MTLLLLGAVMVAGLLGATALSVRAALAGADRGQNHARIGLESVKAGDLTAAAVEFDAAETDLRQARHRLDTWWLAPTRLLPPVRAQIEQAAAVTDAGVDVTATAASAMRSVSADSLRVRDGRVDLDLLADLVGPLDQIDASVSAAADRLATPTSGWVVSPVRQRVERFRTQLHDAAEQTVLARDVLQATPAILGGDGPRRYLVMFQNPAESRASGGYIGSWAVLTATDGHIELGGTGRTDTLALATRAADSSPLTSVPADYLDRYGRFRPERWPGDAGLSPDFPSVATAFAEIYRRTDPAPIDGVISVDPVALGALVQFTGPITADGLDRPLAASEVPEFLERGQYTLAMDRSGRSDLLASLADATLNQLLSSPELPGPAVLASVLGPSVQQHRLMVHLDRPDEQDLMVRLGLDGGFSAPAEGDAFAVITQNGGNDKLDAYVSRSIDYVPRFDPTTGFVRSTLRVRIENHAPVATLPPFALGTGMRGRALGDALTSVSAYSVLGLDEARVDGAAVGTEVQREQGFNVYSRYVVVPNGGSVTIEFALAGPVTGDGSNVWTWNQPTVNPDRVTMPPPKS